MKAVGMYKFKSEDAWRFAREQNIQAFQRGDELIFTRCPYCKQNTDKKFKFAINLNTGMFKCMRASCDAHGNMLTIAKDFNFSLGADVDRYHGIGYGWRKFRQLPQTQHETKPEAVAYLESRGISKAIAEKYRITVRKDRPDVLVFPFYDEDGTLQMVKYRNTTFKQGDAGSKEFSEKNCKPILFGMSQCNRENDTLILTEGQIDSLSVAEAGLENAVSVPTGANGFTWVPYCWDWLQSFRKLIVFGDHEKGHITLLDEMKARFHGELWHVREEDYLDCKDANDLLRKYGKDAVRKAVENAVRVDNPHIIDLSTVERVNMASMEVLSTGFRTLDMTLGGFYFGQLILLTGKRGLGKSTLASQFGVEALAHGYKVMFYSGELVDWFFRDWIDRQIVGDDGLRTLHSNLGWETYFVKDEIAPQVADWYKGRAFLYRNTFGDDAEEREGILETLQNSIRQYGCRVLFIDNLMTAMEDDITSDLYRQQTVFVRNLANMAKRENVLIFLVAHPRKSNGQIFDNDDIAGSSNITNLVDVTLAYSEPKPEEGDAEPDYPRVLQVYKNRLTGKLNKKGIPLWFQDSSKRISDKAGEFAWDYKWSKQTDGFMPVGDDDEPNFD